MRVRVSISRFTPLWIRFIAIFGPFILALVGAIENGCSVGLATELTPDNNLKILAEIKKGRTELEKIPISNTRKLVRYLEDRKSGDGVRSMQNFTDFASKEVIVKLFNIKNSQTKIIKIKKVGGVLININKAFHLELEERPSGIKWNGYNTGYTVIKPENWIVILNKYPTRQNNGARKDVIFAPYSTSLHNEDLIALGDKNIKHAISHALKELDTTKPGMNFYSRFARIIERFILLEQSDITDFNDFKNGRYDFNPFERVKIVIALNGIGAYNLTGSPANAKGLMQFTRPTWNMMMKNNPWAKLPAFTLGSNNPHHSIKAAALLHYHNTEELKRRLGSQIDNGSNLEYYLAAGYNGGIVPVAKAIKNSEIHKTGWRKELRKLKKTDENLEYLEKLDYLLKNDK